MTTAKNTDSSADSYVLYCTVCQSNHNSKENWLQHLLKRKHQHRARVDVLEWNKDMRECSLVVFLESPVTRKSESEELLKLFSSKVPGIIVTDYVYCPSRPCVRFVQFESRKKLEEILSGFGSTEIRIGNRLVECRCAGDLLDLQWKSYLPEEEKSSVESAGTLVRSPLRQLYKPNEKPQFSWTTPLYLNLTTLQSQFEAFAKAVEIPDEEFSVIQTIVEDINKCGATHEPPFKAWIFRHSYLKLRLNSTYSEYSQDINWLIYISSIDDKPVANRKQVTNAIYEYLASKTYFCGWNKGYNEQDSSFNLGEQFIDPHGKTSFTLVYCALALVEARLSILTEYLLRFDARCRPLLQLVYFWANSNKIQLGLDGYNMRKSVCPICVPEPVALEWLLISFLSGTAKIIPTPREVFARSSNPATEIMDMTFPDLGFSTNENYIHEWSTANNVRRSNDNAESDAFYLSVIDLAHKFFAFYGKTLSQGNWVCNTKDGEFLLMRRFVTEGGNDRLLGTRLNPDELKLARSSSGIHFGSKLYIIHPINLTWTLSVRDSAVPRMKKNMRAMGNRLKRFIAVSTNERRERGEIIDLLTILNFENKSPVKLLDFR